MDSPGDGPMRVVIAGAGVAGVEAALALSELAGDRVAIELLSPKDEFLFRPLQVAEPFGASPVLRIGVSRIAEDAGARHVKDALISVDPAVRSVTMASGAEIGYDALVVALGATPVEAVPGALTFSEESTRRHFSKLLAQLGNRRAKRIAFVAPAAATWSIAAYELALLTAAERDARRLRGVEILVVTHEKAPLDLFGEEASQLVAARLEEADITLHVSTRVDHFADGELLFTGGPERIPVDMAVALPALQVRPLPGLPQRHDGFVVTDTAMHVAGMEHVWAAGDVTWFPIKQGGLAAQQAGVAARSIAARAGAHVPIAAFRPVLRGELITGGAPAFLRASRSAPASDDATSGRPLWSPPTKIAAEFLGPYIERVVGGGEPGELVDLEPRDVPEGNEGDADHAVSLILAAAEADAAGGDHAAALDWLEIVEQLNLVLPPEYVARRFEWRRELEPGLAPSAAEARIDPSFDGAAAAIKDIERRVGWLREEEQRTGAEMDERLDSLERGKERLLAICRRSGILE